MKKYFIISGAIGFILLFTGVFFKLNHFPAANLISIVGTLVGVSHFVVGVFIKTEGERLPCVKVIETFLPLSMAVMLLAFLFKMLHWPGANIMILVGSIMLTLNSIILTIAMLKSKGNCNLSVSKVVFSFNFIILFVMYILSVVFFK
jgi:hypothetical protein